MNKKYSIRPLQIFEANNVPKEAMTYRMNYNVPFTMSGYIFFIEGADKRIIVDTSGAAETLARRGIPAKQVATPEEALKKVGLKLEDIDIVIFTHLHGDHMEYASKFTRAQFIVQSEELKAALNPHPVELLTYRPDLYKNMKFTTVSGDQEIVDGIRVMLTPGHSPGGNSVVVETDEGTAVITGMCGILENFEPPEPIRQVMPMILPAVHEDTRELWESMLRIKQVADIIVPLHEQRWATVDRIP
jgi:glyoxylase-like metal-dependent hydrolase (beta-lactamase superfamily II)